MDRRVINGIVFVALLFAAFSSVNAQTVPTLQNLKLLGPVRSLGSETIRYSYRLGDREIVSTQRGMDYEFDRRGLVASEASYDSKSLQNRRRVFTFDAEKRILGIDSFDRNEVLTDSEEYTYDLKGGYTRTEYDVVYPARKILDRITVYDEAGLVIKQTDYFMPRDSREPIVSSTLTMSKSPTYTRYVFSDGTRYSSFVVDSRGAVMSNYYSYGNRVVSFEYHYDSSGRLDKVDANDGNTRSSWGLTYNALGQVSQIEHRDNLDRLQSRVELAYESDYMSSKKSVRYDIEGNPLFTWRYVFDSDGNEINKTLSFAQFPEQYVWRTQYSNGKANEQTVRNGAGRILEGFRLSYDAKGLLSREVLLGRNAFVRKKVDQTLRSEKEVESYTSSNAGGVIDKHYANIYDESGKLLRTTTYNSDISVLTIKEYRYEYDRFGNWTHMEIYESSNPQEYYERLTQSTTRTINYY